MKTITKSFMACCFFMLLIGCHKVQNNATGIIMTEYQYNMEWPRILAHYDTWGLYFDFVIDSEDKYDMFCSAGCHKNPDDIDELLCSGGWPPYPNSNPEESGGIKSLVIPESIVANVPFCYQEVFYSHEFLGYHTTTLTVIGISVGAFKDCSNLTSVTFPNSIREIGRIAFTGCSSLATCTCCALDPPEVYWNSFEDCPLQAIYVPRESVETYKTADGWEHYADIIYPIE